MVLLELRCSLLHMTMAQQQTGNPQKMGRKITTSSGWQETVCCLLRCFHREKKCKGKYAKEIPEPTRNNNTILGNNLLFMKHSSEGKKKKPTSFLILNGKTTKPQIAVMEVKCRWHGKHSFVTITPFQLPLDYGRYSTGQTEDHTLYLWSLWSLLLSLKQEIKNLLINTPKSSKNPRESSTEIITNLILPIKMVEGKEK